MRTAYKTLAFLIAAEVVIQAAAIVYAVSGLFIWVDNDGGVLDKAALESDAPFPEITGFIVHGINGMMVVPGLALVLLILSFFTRAPGAAKWAAFVLASVVVQVLLGMFLHSTSAAGLLHGVNALVLFGLALTAGRRMPRSDAAVAAPVTEEAHA
jgi:hypothetical protein